MLMRKHGEDIYPILFVNTTFLYYYLLGSRCSNDNAFILAVFQNLSDQPKLSTIFASSAKTLVESIVRLF